MTVFFFIFSSTKVKECRNIKLLELFGGVLKPAVTTVGTLKKHRSETLTHLERRKPIHVPDNDKNLLEKMYVELLKPGFHLILPEGTSPYEKYDKTVRNLIHG